MAVTALAAGEVETDELIPQPESRITAQATRLCQATFEGGSYLVPGFVVFNRLVVLFTAITMAPLVSIYLYQTRGGGGGVATRVATFTKFAASAATLTLTPSEGTVELVPGRVFVLFGFSGGTGTATLRTYNPVAADLLNQSVPANFHPVSYSTAIASTTTPATFDPRSGTGQAVSSINNVLPIFRLRKV